MVAQNAKKYFRVKEGRLLFSHPTKLGASCEHRSGRRETKPLRKRLEALAKMEQVAGVIRSEVTVVNRRLRHLQYRTAE